MEKKLDLDKIKLIIICPETNQEVISTDFSISGWEESENGGIDLSVYDCPSCGKAHHVSSSYGV